MKGRAFAAVVLSALLLLSGLGIGGWWLLWQRGPLQLAHHPLRLPRAARFVPASASFSLYLFSDGQRPVDYARAVAPARQRRPAGEAIARLRDGAFAAAGLDYQDELAGWLGGDIAMALFEDPVAAAAAGSEPEQPARGWLLALASRDDDGARRFLQRFWQTRSLAGTDLQVSRYRGMGLISGRGGLVGSRPEPLATALVDDDLVLIASGRNLLERALDVSQIPELNQAGQPLLRQGVAAFGRGAALAVASPQALQSWLGLPAIEPAAALATPVALSEAAAAARGLPRTAALAAVLPDPADSGSALAGSLAESSPSAAQSPATAPDATDAATAGAAASQGGGSKVRNAAPAGDPQLLERPGALGQGLDAASQSASAAPESVGPPPAPALQPQEWAEGPQKTPPQAAAARSTPAGGASQSPGAPSASSPQGPAAPPAPAAGSQPAGASPLPQSRSAESSASQPAPPTRVDQAPFSPLPVHQETAAERPAAPPAPATASPSPSVSSPTQAPPTGSSSPTADSSPTATTPRSSPPAQKQTPLTSAEPPASPSRLNSAAPSLLAVLQPRGRQLELRARLLLPAMPRLMPVQPELSEALLAALRGSPTSLALIQDPEALEHQPLLRPLLMRSLGLVPQAQAERQGPLPALLARSMHGPLLASQAPEGWQLVTRAGDPAAADLEPQLSQAGLLEAPLAFEGHNLRVWTRLSPPGRSARSGRSGTDVLVAPLAGWSEPRQELAWWGQTLAALDAPADSRALTALRRGLHDLGAPQAPLQWSVDAETARALLRAWQPWRLLSALAGGGLDGPVRGLALAVESPADATALELRARLSLGA